MNIRIGIQQQIIIHHQGNTIDIQHPRTHNDGNHNPNGPFVAGERIERDSAGVVGFVGCFVVAAHEFLHGGGALGCGGVVA